MPALYYGKRTAVSAIATTEAVGFPASNILTEVLGRPYHATGLGATDVTIQYAAAGMVYAVFVHDVNFASCTVQKSSDGVNFVNVGTLTAYADRHGRRRGMIVVNDANVKAIRLQIGAGASTDGAAYWNIGAYYGFTNTVTPGASPKFGYTVRTKRPRSRADLGNGLVAVASLGLNIDRIELTFDRRDSEVVDDVVQKCSTGTTLLDLGLGSYPAQLWPVKFLEPELEETFNTKRNSTMPIPLQEVV